MSGPEIRSLVTQEVFNQQGDRERALSAAAGDLAAAFSDLLHRLLEPLSPVHRMASADERMMVDGPATAAGGST